jgi:hypothetical protein
MRSVGSGDTSAVYAKSSSLDDKSVGALIAIYA